MTTAFDAILSLGLVACAGAALVLRDRTAAVAAFMITGLLVALSWVRLERRTWRWPRPPSARA